MIVQKEPCLHSTEAHQTPEINERRATCKSQAEMGCEEEPTGTCQHKKKTSHTAATDSYLFFDSTCSCSIDVCVFGRVSSHFTLELSICAFEAWLAVVVRSMWDVFLVKE